MTLRARAAPKVAVLIAVALLGARSIAQPSAPGKAPGATPAPDASRAAPAAAPDSPPAADPLASWTARLSRLDPARPREYFELAEEMADAAASRPEDRAAARQTAQRLCVLAFELWRGSQNRKDFRAADPRLGPSALLLLADLSEASERARWLRAVAAAVDPDALLTPDASTPAAPTESPDQPVIELVSSLELLRAGDGRRAGKIMDKPAVHDLFLRYERLLSPGGLTGEADRLRQIAQNNPICPECRNRRFIRGPGGVSLCPSCGGDPGPNFSYLEILYQLRFEAAVLEGIQSSWVAQTLVDGGRPLRDLDPEEIALTLNVDPSLTLYRRDGWVAPVPVPKPARQAPDGPPAPSEQPVAAPAAGMIHAAP